MQFFVYFTMQPGQAMPKAPPTPERMAEIMKFHQDAMQAGEIVATGRLGQQVTTVRRDGDAVSVTDGPFIESKEMIPGFTIIDVPDHAAAVAWVTRYRDMMGMPELRIASIQQ
jgi:hypothetical protein